MDVKQYTLDNGLTILMDKINHISSVNFRILFNVGSKDEKLEQNGIAHFIEHMHFKGTNTKTAADIAHLFDNIGGYINACTSHEFTMYYTKVLNKDIFTAIEAIMDMNLDSIYDYKEIEREKKVVREEILQSLDDPHDQLSDEIHANIFKDHKIGMPIAGNIDTVNNLTRDDIKYFTAQHYLPNNAVIGISGNFNEEEVLEYLQNYTKDWHSNTLPLREQESIFYSTDTRIQKDLEQVHLTMLFNTVSLYHPDFYIHQLAANIAGGGMSSRLFQEVRENRGLAYTINAFSTNYRTGGYWGLYSATSPDKINELITTSANEIKKMANDVTDIEVQKAKTQMQANILMGLENSGVRADKMIYNYSTFGRVLSIDEILDKINMVSKHDVMAFMSTLGQRVMGFGIIGNIGDTMSYDNIINILIQ